MEAIITNEFIAYKSGFIDGKNEILTQLIENNGLDIFVKENFSSEEETWYSHGYEDGYKQTLNEYAKTKKLQLEQNKQEEKERIKSCFAKRVIEFNQENNKEIPVAKFRI